MYGKGKRLDIPRLIQRNTSGLEALAVLGEAIEIGCPGIAGTLVNPLKALGNAKNPRFIKGEDQGFSPEQACHSRNVPAIKGNLHPAFVGENKLILDCNGHHRLLAARPAKAPGEGFKVYGRARRERARTASNWGACKVT